MAVGHSAAVTVVLALALAIGCGSAHAIGSGRVGEAVAPVDAASRSSVARSPYERAMRLCRRENRGFGRGRRNTTVYRFLLIDACMRNRWG